MGTKNDLELEEREKITLTDAEHFCSEMSQLHEKPFIVSAKTGEGVSEAFHEIAELLYDLRSLSGETRRRSTVHPIHRSVSVGGDYRDTTLQYSTNCAQKSNCAQNKCNLS